MAEEQAGQPVPRLRGGVGGQQPLLQVRVRESGIHPPCHRPPLLGQWAHCQSVSRSHDEAISRSRVNRETPQSALATPYAWLWKLKEGISLTRDPSNRYRDTSTTPTAHGGPRKDAPDGRPTKHTRS